MTASVEVPVEPSDDMLIAGQEAWVVMRAGKKAVEDCEHAAAVWKAMLAAAPNPAPRVSDGRSFSMTKEEVIRIRNSGCGSDWSIVWNRQLNELCEVYLQALSLNARGQESVAQQLSQEQSRDGIDQQGNMPTDPGHDAQKLVERLKGWHRATPTPIGIQSIKRDVRDAAAAIERLTREVAEAEEAAALHFEARNEQKYRADKTESRLAELTAQLSSARADERGRCAKVCERRRTSPSPLIGATWQEPIYRDGDIIATAIRALTDQEQP